MGNQHEIEMVEETIEDQINKLDLLNSYFGIQWDGPNIVRKHHARTPVGEKCFQCEHEIAIGDRGTWEQLVRGDRHNPEQWIATIRPVHRECSFRVIMGDVAHLERRCRCYHPDVIDTEVLDFRQEALDVWEWVQHNGYPIY